MFEIDASEAGKEKTAMFFSVSCAVNNASDRGHLFPVI